jgi:Acetyltransferase (GNAT) domain
MARTDAGPAPHSRSDATVTIGLLQDGDRSALNEFLEARSDSTVFHSLQWADVIRATYGHATRYWTAKAGGRIVGVFPVTVMEAPLLGRKYVAMAYQMHSGHPLADDEDTCLKLVRTAVEDATEGNGRYLEIRHFGESGMLEAAGLQKIDSGLCTTNVTLAGISLQGIRRNHRRGVRSAEEHGVVIEESSSLKDLRSFRDLYRRETRGLGAPQAGWRYFERLHELAQANLHVYLARIDGRVVGGMLTLGGRTIEFARRSAYSTPEALSKHVGTALYWSAIEASAARGCREFSCGLSWTGDPGLIHWKEGWSGVTRPVYLYVHPIRSPAPAPGGYFEGYGMAKALWRRMPLAVVDVIGHQVTRWIG